MFIKNPATCKHSNKTLLLIMKSTISLSDFSKAVQDSRIPIRVWNPRDRIWINQLKTREKSILTLPGPPKIEVIILSFKNNTRGKNQAHFEKWISILLKIIGCDHQIHLNTSLNLIYMNLHGIMYKSNHEVTYIWNKEAN